MADTKEKKRAQILRSLRNMLRDLVSLDGSAEAREIQSELESVLGGGLMPTGQCALVLRIGNTKMSAIKRRLGITGSMVEVDVVRQFMRDNPNFTAAEVYPGRTGRPKGRSRRYTPLNPAPSTVCKSGG